MENLNKIKKIVLYIIAGLLIVLVIIYLFTKDNTIYSNFNNLYQEENMILGTNVIEESKNTIYVYVAGEVNNPSVVELQEGARVVDAIEKAGGLTDSGEIKELNLAYKLKDGEKLYIPSLDEVIESEEESINISYISSGIESTSLDDTAGNAEENINNGLVNINTCTQTELETLEGIGPSTAKKIIEYREENGNFDSIEDIKNVSGIGEAKFNGIKDEICV